MTNNSDNLATIEAQQARIDELQAQLEAERKLRAEFEAHLAGISIGLKHSSGMYRGSDISVLQKFTDKLFSEWRELKAQHLPDSKVEIE